MRTYRMLINGEPMAAEPAPQLQQKAEAAFPVSKGLAFSVGLVIGLAGAALELAIRRPDLAMAALLICPIEAVVVRDWLARRR